MRKGKNLDLKLLDKVIKDTVDAMEKGKEQIYDIYEAAESEVLHVAKDIDKIREETNKIIVKVDLLEKAKKKARADLVIVSSNFNLYSEEKIKQCYENAQKLQIQLAVMREQEQNLRRKRDELEVRLKQLQGTAEKAKQLVSQVGVMLGLLCAQMGQVADKIETLNQDKILVPSIIKAQEDERLRISREIHDGPAQMMANIVYHAEICERWIDKDKDKAKKELQELRNLVRGCLSETRDIIFDLRPMALDDLGLEAATTRFIETIKVRYGIDLKLRFFGMPKRLPNHIEVSVFRVIQESINNIVKHSKTTEAKVSLEFNDEFLIIHIEDKGIGFAVDEKNQSSSSYGLIGMRERIKLLHGKLKISSEANKGTKLEMVIPLK